MQKRLLIILMLLNTAGFGQYAPFKKYNFNQGGYSILGMKDECDYNQLAANLGEFYTDDIKVLNQIKRTWVFDKKTLMYSCGYHYTVLLCKNGKILEDVRINLNCGEVMGKKGPYYFDIKKLSSIKDKLKKPDLKNLTFNSGTEARAYLLKTYSDKNLIVTPHTQWEKYDGEFRFDCKFKSANKDSERSKKTLLKKLEAEIRKSYPNEPFNVSYAGGSINDMTVEVSCRKSLRDKFKLYPIEKFFAWSPYSLDLTTYSFKK